jgi:small subunit ribosomal protein S4
MVLCGKPTNKCAWERRKSPPGDKSPMSQRRRPSEYGMQLKEKQKARFMYGIVEKQFRNYFKKAIIKSGVSGDNLMSLLEHRLDNVIYRLGFADTRQQARQVINHGHIRVNDIKVSSPSYQIKIGEKISWTEKSKKSKLLNIIKAESGKNAIVPNWLKIDTSNSIGEAVASPNAEDFDPNIDIKQIIEYYSR